MTTPASAWDRSFAAAGVRDDTTTRNALMATRQRRILLVRHGETEWSITGQHTGITNIPLTDHGRQVARRLEPVLASYEFTRVWTSPLSRARETSALAGLGPRAEVEPDLVEWNYGDYEGLTPGQIAARRPEWMIFADGCPGGESPKQVGARADRVLAKARAETGDVALFGHGHILRVLAARWIGLPASGGRHFALDTATVSILSYYHDWPTIQRWNAAIARATG